MIRAMLSVIVAAASIAAAPARATEIRYTYAGTVADTEASGYTGALPVAGETVTGSLTVFLPERWDSFLTDGSTVALGESDGPAGMVGGTAVFSGGTTFSQSLGAPGFLSEQLLRNDGGLNEAAVATSTHENGYYWQLELAVFDYFGAGSTLFTDPDGGLSFAQGVDLAGESAVASFAAFSDNGPSNYAVVVGLTSLSISLVPEPADALLLVAGLVCLRMTRRSATDAFGLFRLS